jgi:hypothetical protein
VKDRASGLGPAAAVSVATASSVAADLVPAFFFQYPAPIVFSPHRETVNLVIDRSITGIPPGLILDEYKRIL